MLITWSSRMSVSWVSVFQWFSPADPNSTTFLTGNCEICLSLNCDASPWLVMECPAGSISIKIPLAWLSSLHINFHLLLSSASSSLGSSGDPEIYLALQIITWCSQRCLQSHWRKQEARVLFRPLSSYLSQHFPSHPFIYHSCHHPTFFFIFLLMPMHKKLYTLST